MTDRIDGRYVIVRQLGMGGNGVLFEATDLKIGRPVVIKTLPPHPTREAIERLQREGRVAAAVSHPHVCAVTDMGQLASGAPYLVLELLRGETLDERLARVGRLPVEVALAFGAQMLAGIAALHASGVVHRDVKPGNLFLVDVGLASEPSVKVIDFGTALVPDVPEDGSTLTQLGFVVGTAAYMSPEQVRGLRDFDARTDVYSAAVVLYEMLAGSRPFEMQLEEDGRDAIAYQQARPIASVRADIPIHAARAIDQALSNDRARRYADANVFLRALRGVTAAPQTGVTQVLSLASARPPEPAAAGDWDLATTESGPPAFIDVERDHPGRRRPR